MLHPGDDRRVRGPQLGGAVAAAARSRPTPAPRPAASPHPAPRSCPPRSRGRGPPPGGEARRRGRWPCARGGCRHPAGRGRRARAPAARPAPGRPAAGRGRGDARRSARPGRGARPGSRPAVHPAACRRRTSRGRPRPAGSGGPPARPPATAAGRPRSHGQAASSSPEPMSATSGGPRPASSSTPTLSVKPVMRKFDWCTFSSSASRSPCAVTARSKSDRRVRLVVPTSTSCGAGLLHHVGQPEAAADLHQLRARHGHRPPSGQGRQGQQDRGRAVVDDQRRLRPARGRPQRRHVVGAGAPPAAVEAQLEVRVGGGLGVGDRRPAQVRVEQDAGGVDHGREQAPSPGLGSGAGRARVAGGDRLPGGLDQQGVGEPDVAQAAGDGIHRGRPGAGGTAGAAPPVGAHLSPRSEPMARDPTGGSPGAGEHARPSRRSGRGRRLR